MTTTKRTGTAVGAAVLLAATAACGVGGSEQTTSEGTASGEVSGSITFQTWNLMANFQDYFDGLVDEFEAQNPGATVKWVDQPADGYADKLSADAAAGTLPDVINIDPGSGYPLAEAGLLLDIAQVDPDAEQDFLPEAWEGSTWPAAGKGGTFSYPWYLSTGPSLFNTALFERAGMDPTALPTTFDDLFDQALAMAKQAGGAYTMIGSSPSIEVMGMYGVPLMNDEQTEFTFNDAKAVELVERYKELYENGGMLQESLSQNYTGQDNQFQSGKIAYMPGSAYNVEQIQQNAPTVYQTLKIAPIITNERPNMFPQMMGVSAQSENQATAIAFAKFVTNKTNQLAFAKEVSVFPSSADTLDDPYFTESDGSDAGDVRQQSAAQIADAVAYSIPMFTEAMKTELRDQVALAITGEKGVQQALDDAVTYCNDRLSTR